MKPRLTAVGKMFLMFDELRKRCGISGFKAAQLISMDSAQYARARGNILEGRTVAVVTEGRIQDATLVLLDAYRENGYQPLTNVSFDVLKLQCLTHTNCSDFERYVDTNLEALQDVELITALQTLICPLTVATR